MNDQVLDFTDYQYEFGQGENGVGPASPGAPANPVTGQWSFGPRIRPGMTQVLYNNVVVPYVAQTGRLNDFYRNGSTLTNSISISATSDKGGMNVSVSNMTYQKHLVLRKTLTTLMKKIKIHRYFPSRTTQSRQHCLRWPTPCLFQYWRPINSIQ